ncbi:ATP-binding protein [Methanolobus bombayensis]|nr:ATP-binding protein [Methanolobus bombayensis]MBP1910720.1 signal transduction histidine kinase [Methanolobus bombayensis]
MEVVDLALAQKIIELHKGTIWVESEIGNGTTFTVQLPLNKSLGNN